MSERCHELEKMLGQFFRPAPRPRKPKPAKVRTAQEDGEQAVFYARKGRVDIARFLARRAVHKATKP